MPTALLNKESRSCSRQEMVSISGIPERAKRGGKGRVGPRGGVRTDPT